MTLAATLTLLAALPALPQDTSASEGKVPWLKDYAKALEAAEETGKPLVIYFGCC